MGLNVREFMGKICPLLSISGNVIEGQEHLFYYAIEMTQKFAYRFDCRLHPSHLMLYIPNMKERSNLGFKMA